MYKETFPFENGWSHFHFTKRRFLFVLQNKEQGCPSAIFMAYGTAPLCYMDQGRDPHGGQSARRNVNDEHGVEFYR
jgi:hypothetical protein